VKKHAWRKVMTVYHPAYN